MARVSQEHLAARRQQILDAARRCFITNGFHATSMQDILAEANLSSGGLYRYFRSKEEIIIAIARDVLANMAVAIEDALEPNVALDADEILGRLFRTLEQVDSEERLARMAVQVWSEALRSPAVAAQVREAMGGTIDVLTSRVRFYQSAGTIDNSVAPELVARAIIGVMPGFMLQRAVFGDVDSGAYRSAYAALLRREHGP